MAEASSTTSEASTTSEETKTAAAAAVFALFLGAVAGGAGILIAAIAVGAERAWNGRPGRSRAGGRARWGDRVAAYRSWLDDDRAARRQWRKDHREWIDKGGDPKSEPPRPTRSVRMGKAARRGMARIVMALDGTRRFASGFREGWGAARAAKQDGGKFGDIVRARPADAAQPGPAVDGVAAAAAAPVQTSETNKTVADKDLPNVPAAEPPGPAAVTPSEYRAAWYLLRADRLRAASANIVGQSGQARPAAQDAQPADEHGTTQTPDAPAASAGTTSGSQPRVNTEGAQMSAPQGETNLDQTAADLDNINRQLAEINETVDRLAQQKQNLLALAAQAGDRANANGGTSATLQALDSAMAAASSISTATGNISDHVTEATDHTNAAHEGLNPARDAQDTLQSAGARGDFVATATSD